MVDLLQCLLQTGALRIAPADRPFWYTSGTLGPYYINTEYLYGGQERAERFLEVIEREKDDPLRCPSVLLGEARKTYAEDAVYRGVVDRIAEVARTRVDLEAVDYISGGERRDWFFSLMAGEVLKKPLLMIFKDLNAVSAGPDGRAASVERLDGRRTLHVADLITEASSYTRAWVPAIARRGGRLAYAINVVDRDQGGEKALRDQGVEAHALARIDDSLFETLRRQGEIDEAQFRALMAYRADPKGAMRAFLLEHPGFLKEALASPDAREAGRARLLVETDPYGIGTPGR
jgi:orotate phosphoribosyltransferase